MEQNKKDESSKKIKELMLSKKFRQYFFPSIIAAVAMSLSDFVDGLAVSNLLDSTALAVINVCLPLVCLMASVYVFLGAGGAIVYSEYLGKRDEKSASRVITTSLLTALIVGIILMFLGLLFLVPLCNLICPGMVLGQQLVLYTRVLVISTPFFVVVNLILTMLPSAGAPTLSMALNIGANVLNLILDIVFIKGFGFGVEGAAYATLISFSLAGVVVIFFVRRINLKFGAFDLSLIKEVAAKGAASSLSQIGFFIKFTFCNAMVSILGGANGLVAFSLCIQTLAIISIVINGAVDTMKPLISFLRSQEDYKGVKYVFEKVCLVTFIASAAFTALLFIYPQAIIYMFNASQAGVMAIAISALRVFSFTILLRTMVIIFMVYTSILGETAYSTYISLFDGFIGIVVIGFVLSRIFGVSGIWMAYPVDAALLIISVYFINRHLMRRYPDRFENIFLIEKGSANVHLFDFALEDRNEDISELSKRAISFCRENGISESLSKKIGLCAEEMAIYTRQHKSKDDWLNLMLRIEDGKATLDFRSLGLGFDLNEISDKDLEENFKILRSLTPEFEYTYSLGMNNTRFTFDS